MLVSSAPFFTQQPSRALHPSMQIYELERVSLATAGPQGDLDLSLRTQCLIANTLSLSPIFCTNPIWTDIVLLPSALDVHLKGNKQTLLLVTTHITKLIETIIWGAFFDFCSARKHIGFDAQKLTVPTFFQVIEFLKYHSILTNLIEINWIRNDNPIHLKLTVIILDYVWKVVSMLWLRRCKQTTNSPSWLKYSFEPSTPGGRT